MKKTRTHSRAHDYMVLGRWAIAFIYIWFGLLKVLNISPAEGLVTELLQATMPFFDAVWFGMLFGLFEVMIGLLFLFPAYSRITLWIFLAHMAMTFLPLILLPHTTWKQPFVYTLMGQYITKNIALISLALIVLQEPIFQKKK